MKFLSAQIHGILDYLTVVIFAAAPTVLGLSGLAAIISYTLAAIHLLMTLLTNMPLGAVKVIPMRLHSIVELLVGPVLVLGGIFLPDLPAIGHYFFTAMGVVIILVWLVTDYAGALSRVDE